MELMMPADAVFLLGESREHPMHVGGLQLYEPPAGAGPEFVRELYDNLVAQQDFQPTNRKRPSTFFGMVTTDEYAKVHEHRAAGLERGDLIATSTWSVATG